MKKKHHVGILISEQDVRARIQTLGHEITPCYQQKQSKVIVVGSYVVVYVTELVRLDLRLKSNLPPLVMVQT